MNDKTWDMLLFCPLFRRSVTLVVFIVVTGMVQATDLNIVNDYSGDAGGLDPVNMPGGYWGSYNLRLGNGATGKSISITSGNLYGANSGARSLEINGTGNKITFSGPTTVVTVNSAKNWSTGSFMMNGTDNKMIVSNSAQFVANGWNALTGTRNEIRVTGAGSVATFSADNNDGFGDPNPNPATSTSCRVNVVAGGTFYIRSSAHTFTSSTAGTYAINVDGALGHSTFGTSGFWDFSAAPPGGILRAFNGGALEAWAGNVSFAVEAVVWNKIIIDGGTLSYKDAIGVNMGESLSGGGVSQFSWQSNNAFRLNNSSATDTGPYTLADPAYTGNPKNYARLELINGTSSVARVISVYGDSGGSILFSGTTAMIANGVTLYGAAVFTAEGTNNLTGVIGGIGSLVKLGTGHLTLNEAGTYTGDTMVREGSLRIASPCLYDRADVYVATNSTFDLGFVGTNSIRDLYLDGVRCLSGLYGRDGDGGPAYFSGAGFLKIQPGSVVIIR